MSHAPDTRARSSRQSGSRLVTVLRRMRWPVVITWLSPAGFPRTGPGRWPGPQPWPSAAVAVAAPARARPGAGVSASGGPASHETRVEGILDGRWAAWFGGLQAQGAGAQTVISGLLAGQPGLHGLHGLHGDPGLCLISVRRLDPDEPETGGDAVSAVPHHPLTPHASRPGATFG